jgi:hypothetical protein
MDNDRKLLEFGANLVCVGGCFNSENLIERLAVQNKLGDIVV